MSLTFKDDENEKNPAGEKEMEQYKTAGQNRNLCFVQPNGESLFLNYAYLVAGKFSPNDSSIVLAYTTHTVTLNGHNLDALYDSIMNQRQRTIICIDKRYAETMDETWPIVYEIIVVG